MNNKPLWKFKNLTNKEYVDEAEAPEGYYAVPKSSIKSNENVCNHCDWRSDCNKKVCSCMSYDRKDEVGVIFKLKEGTNE